MKYKENHQNNPFVRKYLSKDDLKQYTNNLILLTLSQNYQSFINN